MRPLEQDALAGLVGLVQQAPGRLGVGQDLGRDRHQLIEQRLAVGLGQAEPPTQGAVVAEQALDLGLEGFGIGQVGDADGAAADLVFIGRANAAAGGADLLAGGGLAALIQVLVQRQDQGGVVGQHQQVRADDHALLGDLGDFGEQVPGIDHHAVADDRQLALHDARRQQSQLVDLALDHQGVAGIVAALETHDDVRPVGQPVDDLTLALVAPLGADNGHIGHVQICLITCRKAPAALRQDSAADVSFSCDRRSGPSRRGRPVQNL